MFVIKNNRHRQRTHGAARRTALRGAALNTRGASMLVHEFLVSQHSRLSSYIADHEDDIHRAHLGLPGYFFVPGAGGYHNMLIARPWDDESTLPSVPCETCRAVDLLAAELHATCFLDDLTPIDAYDEEDFAKENAMPEKDACAHIVHELESCISCLLRSAPKPELEPERRAPRASAPLPR